MILKGEKAILRTVRLSDAPRFVKWFNDPEVNKFLLVREMNLRDEKEWIKNRLKKQNSKGNPFFCIDTKQGVHIGSASLEVKSFHNRCAGFGIVIGDKNYWNKGYGSEVVKLIIEYGFKKLKLHRIELDVYGYNKRAQKVYKKLGFKLEGKKREHNFWNGKFWDTYNMAILDREWKKLNK
jgi:RimJ/RimL family protein N-acetyltransferase